MRGIIYVIVAAVAMWWGLTGCVERLSKTEYHVECNIDKSLNVDSVALIVHEDSYDKLKLLSRVSVDSATGAFIFDGQIEKPCVAMLKFDNDSNAFMFVLEPGETLINIAASGVVITGGELNHDYMSYLKHREAIMDERMELLKNYRQLAAPDSMVDIDNERHMVMQDSILADSLDRVTVSCINRADAVGRIVFDRYVNTLSPRNLSRINTAK